MMFMAKAIPKKMCILCNKVQNIENFLPNRSWGAQQNCDIYCKACARSLLHDKDDVRRYCWENNRLYTDEMWDAAKNKAMRALANNATFIAKTTSESKKIDMLTEKTAQMCLTVMNLPYYYRYHDNADKDGNLPMFNPDSMAGMFIRGENGDEVVEDDVTRYSREWNGMFTKRELDYLNDYYERLSDSFSLEDVSMQDYARKVAKASLDADKMYDAYRAGRVTQKVWLDSQNAFDSMSRSSAFTAAQRKEKNSDSNKVLAEIIADIEINHHAEMPLVTFPPDDIDKILEDFRHTEDAIK